MGQIAHAKRLLNDFPTIQQLEERKSMVEEKRKLMRQWYSENFQVKSRAPEDKTPYPSTVEELSKETKEIPQRSVTNIVFMVSRSPRTGKFHSASSLIVGLTL